jgi:hypothetical protein
MPAILPGWPMWTRSGSREPANFVLVDPPPGRSSTATLRLRCPATIHGTGELPDPVVATIWAGHHLPEAALTSASLWRWRPASECTTDDGETGGTSPSNSQPSTMVTVAPRTW